MHAKPTLPATPWGLLPPRLRVLFVATPRRTGDWLAEVFAGDSACQVSVEEAMGPAAALTVLREQAFDVVLVTHEPGDLDALAFVEALRAGGGDEPIVILGQTPEQQMAALCFEAGAEAYACAATITTRTLLWIIARATEHRNLVRENRRLTLLERHRREHELSEARRLLAEQRALSQEDADASAPWMGDELASHYQQLLKAHVIMGSGNLANEIAALVEQLAAAGMSAPRMLHLHVEVLEEMVRGLGNRGARHIMTRADLLALEVLIHLAERYRTGEPSSAERYGHKFPDP
ncbi:MAG TPA: hypothetical protein VHV08_08240 [Pirellulales bacterium]|nr:hypothetical protein [Pirellulales bacterium]